MENRVVDMRELYQEWKDFDEDNPVSEEKNIYKVINQRASSSSVTSYRNSVLRR